MNLLDILRAYPGGITQLAIDANVPAHTLYRLGHREHRRKPVQAIDRIATAFRGKVVLGRSYGVDDLLKLWEELPAERSASEVRGESV